MELLLNNFFNLKPQYEYHDIIVATIDVSKNMSLRIDIQNSIFNSTDKKENPSIKTT
ncbi:hypothetical protein PL321_16560 [Caloramator sp. mosi_1]|uniref:hypothetical protein n=1 Tax=Caloramator sp. mosi_1 TaxID=3023090 RepID=UPI002361694F|nr:hypothetical protein [Caloramator sp. mosi_1]WDC83939.1 hypothetical protein PL321_16270 [Caloramator sp. mosi_1]WDC83976.1 hypothetical protein PL321_16560 [Caloramator sp. mosi_1]